MAEEFQNNVLDLEPGGVDTSGPARIYVPVGPRAGFDTSLGRQPGAPPPPPPNGFDRDYTVPQVNPGGQYVAPLPQTPFASMVAAIRKKVLRATPVSIEAAAKGMIVPFLLDNRKGVQILPEDDERLHALIFNQSANNILIGSESQADPANILTTNPAGILLPAGLWPAFIWPSKSSLWAIGTQAPVSLGGQSIAVAVFTYHGDTPVV
jgi:hypothetical protein